MHAVILKVLVADVRAGLVVTTCVLPGQRDEHAAGEAASVFAPTRLTLWVRPGLENYCRKHVAPKFEHSGGDQHAVDDDRRCWSAGDAAFREV